MQIANVKMKDENSPARRPIVQLGGPNLGVILLAFGLLLAAVWWRGILGAVIFLLASVSAAIALVPRLRRRDTWLFYLLFVAVAACILIVLKRGRAP